LKCVFSLHQTDAQRFAAWRCCGFSAPNSHKYKQIFNSRLKLPKNHRNRNGAKRLLVAGVLVKRKSSILQYLGVSFFRFPFPRFNFLCSKFRRILAFSFSLFNFKHKIFYASAFYASEFHVSIFCTKLFKFVLFKVLNSAQNFSRF
jgi:hypothetical protein